MDLFLEKQVHIRQHRDEIVARYPALWQNITAEWKQPGPDDRAWLTYSANYLLRTSNVHWAIDPLTLNWRLKDSAPKVDVSTLGEAAFILLTHRHADHLDLDLLSALRHFPICWVVPEPILAQVIKQAGIPREKIIVPAPLQPIELNGIRITPFDGLHWRTEDDGTLMGAPATGYLAEFSGKRWLFPGDTRTYDASKLPAFGSLDGIFAHIWLGRGCALQGNPRLLDAFCRFCLDLKPRQIILTHLQEFGRDANDYWDEEHTQKVSSKIQELSPDVSVNATLIGETILL